MTKDLIKNKLTLEPKDNIWILQNKNQQAFSMDTIILYAMSYLRKEDKNIIDWFAGNGSSSLLINTKKENLNLKAIEIQKEVYDLAIKNLEINNNNNIKYYNCSFKNWEKYSSINEQDVIFANPPYFENMKNSTINSKNIARHEIDMKIEDIFETAKKILKNNGILYLIHRTNRMQDILSFSRKHNIECKKIINIFPNENKKSKSSFFVFQKTTKKGLLFHKPIYLNNKDGSYTKEYKNMFYKGINNED